MRETGSALIITVLLVTILAALVTEFAYEVYIDTTALSNYENAQKASFIAKSGQTISSKYLAEVKKMKYTYADSLELPVDKDLGTGVILTIKLEDENAKFNINSIIYAQSGKENEKAFSSLKKLFEYLKINPNLALVIADWMDPNSEPRLPGSEDNAKNAPLWSINELMLIKGIDKDVFNKISPYITAYGNNLININTAKLPVLVSLHEDMTETLANSVIAYREIASFENPADIVKVSGMESTGMLIQGRITAKSQSFRIAARATVNEITRIIESVVDSDASMKIEYWREI
ncbi:MAG: type II secretion system minor pseudopilin GspK [Nitrospirae bacterium]|nr:type II secretion system minor pseudopilin GspK [Nitrospirota bacterium]